MGRCAFADRHRYRLELNWRTFDKEPDFDRMLTDYASSLENTWDDVKSARCRGWPGITGNREGEAVSRFGCYYDEARLLVEVVCINESNRDKELESRILDSVRIVKPDAAGYQRWRAFGMDVRVPAAFKLVECVVEPARVGMRFEGAARSDRWIFRRYGMVSSWLTTPVSEWLKTQAGDSVKDQYTAMATKQPITIHRLHGRWKPRGLLSGRGPYAAAAWIEPGDKRLYHAICISGRKSRRWHPDTGADEMLRSCPEFLVVPTP